MLGLLNSSTSQLENQQIKQNDHSYLLTENRFQLHRTDAVCVATQCCFNWERTALCSKLLYNSLLRGTSTIILNRTACGFCAFRAIPTQVNYNRSLPVNTGGGRPFQRPLRVRICFVGRLRQVTELLTSAQIEGTSTNTCTNSIFGTN